MAARAARRGSRDPGPIVPQRPSRSAWMRQPKEPHLLMTQSRQELRNDALAITMAAHRPGTHSRTGRTVFPAMLAVFVLSQIPALFELTATAPWQAFARWFGALPLT